jgi:hypothetical protein
MNATSRNDSPDNGRHRGPSLVVVAGVYIVLFFAAMIVPAATGGSHVPSPFAPAEVSARYFHDQAGAARIGAFFLFGSAIPFGIFAASATSRVQFLGMKGLAGLGIALFGGFAAAILLLLSAFMQWCLALTAPDLAAGTIHAFHFLEFAAGGPGYVVPFGLFVAGISVTSGLQGLVPRWLMFAGLGIAAVAEVSSLVFILPGAAILLPIARFTGLVWMLFVAALLPRARGAVAHRRPARPPLQGPTDFGRAGETHG